jgi:glycerol dehydrogenase-like iron-containing ADH family enzyme
VRPVIGEPFDVVEASAVDLISSLGVPLVVCANDPPWTTVRSMLAATGATIATEVGAWDMEVAHLERVVADLDPDVLAGATVVGVGGGTALDTAKFVAWRAGRPLVQVPTIMSVDAGFTDAIGVRDGGRVRYVGTVTPDCVVLDVPLVRAAPAHLNRAGVGDILSCHTGLHDWHLAAERGIGPAWDVELAALGTTLLDELDAAADDVADVSATAVRFVADAYRRIGAACAHAGHSRFEEGSEHFWAYAYEHLTGAHPVHGEIIALGVCALAVAQDHDPDRARRIVERAGVRAHPDDLGVAREDFVAALVGLRDYARAEGLDHGIADVVDITASVADRAWSFVTDLPRHPMP